MVYFILLPMFLLAVVAQVIVLVGTWIVPGLRPARSFSGRILTWSSIGFVGANATLMVFTVLPCFLYDAAGFEQSGWAFGCLGALAVFGLTLGPLIASALGFMGGLLAGVLLALRAKRSDVPSVTIAGSDAERAPTFSG